MNPASRIFNTLEKMNKIQRKDTQLVDAYKTIFNVTDHPSVFKALLHLNEEVTKLEKIFEASNKQEKSKDLITLLRKISLPMNLQISLSNIQGVLVTLLPKLDVLQDALEIHPSDEKDITEELNTITNELDTLLKNILTLNIPNESKFLYTKITLLLKESILFYQISGTDQINFTLKQFQCITKEIPEANKISEKLLTSLEVASHSTTIAGFIGDFAQKYLS